MSKIWNDIVHLVDSQFVCDNYIRKANEEDIELTEAISVLLENSDCIQYSVSEETIFESCGYDTGVVFAAWIESDGSLQTITYQWELM